MNQLQKSRISLWPRTARESGEEFHTGVIELTPELLQQLNVQQHAGQPLKLDVSLFRNPQHGPGEGSKRPSRTGTIKLWQPRDQQQATPKPKPKPKAQEYNDDF